MILEDDFPYPIVEPSIQPKGANCIGRGQRGKQGKVQGSTKNNNPNSKKESMKNLKT